jgi:ribosomal protein S18 acetylase RimI-like enzyme
MAEFYVSVSEQDMAMQIADMLNRYNGWATRFSAQSLLMTPARYFVELENTIVVGCASHLKEYETLTKIQHICVLPSHRRRGIAARLTELAIDNSETEFVYMTIREDNAASLKLAISLGFKYITKHWFRDHWTLTYGRRKNHGSRSEYYTSGF